jgi:hypothetical protein
MDNGHVGCLEMEGPGNWIGFLMGVANSNQSGCS